MIDIKEIVDVNISLSTVSQIRTEDFSLPMILGTHTVFSELYREYTQPSQLLDDGFRIDSAEYKCASLMFQYDNPIQRLYIGRRLVSGIKIGNTKLKANYNYSVTIGDNTYTYSNPVTPTAIEIAAGIVAAMAADTIVDVIDNLDGTYTITPKVVGTIFTCRVDNYQYFANIQNGQDILDDIAAIKNDVNDWFAIIETLRDKTEVLDLAAWCNANRKLYITASDDINILSDLDTDTDSIAAQFYASEYQFVAAIYHTKLDEYIEASWLGEELRKQAGQSTWALKTLLGITPDNFTDAQLQNLKSKRCNCYLLVGGVGITYYGNVPSSIYLYIDNVRDIEFLKIDIEASLLQKLVSTDKIPYTDAGVAILENLLKAKLQEAVAANILTSDPAPVVTVPKVIDVPAIDKQDRILRNLNWTAELAGAIQRIKINGTLSY